MYSAYRLKAVNHPFSPRIFTSTYPKWYMKWYMVEPYWQALPISTSWIWNPLTLAGGRKILRPSSMFPASETWKKIQRTARVGCFFPSGYHLETHFREAWENLVTKNHIKALTKSCGWVNQLLTTIKESKLTKAIQGPTPGQQLHPPNGLRHHRRNRSKHVLR